MSELESKPSLPPTLQLMQMATGHFLAQAIHVAARFGIADLLEKGPKTITELAKESGTHEASLYRLLRSLSSVGIFKEVEQRKFELTPLAEPLCTDSANSIRNGPLLAGQHFHWYSWGNLSQSIMTGECAFEYVHGKELFEYLSEHPDEATPYNAWMTQNTEKQIQAILSSYDFSPYKKIVDIGGGQGRLVSAILSKYSKLHGILFDSPEVIATSVLKNHNELSSRSEMIGGNFFDSVPSGADLYIMKTVIHDWSDELSVKILTNCQKAMKPDSKLLLIEMVIPEERKPHASFFMDLNMMVLTHGGMERTEAEYRELYKSSDLKLLRVIPTKSPISIIEGSKA